jgi:hypothetical protein
LQKATGRGWRRCRGGHRLHSEPKRVGPDRDEKYRRPNPLSVARSDQDLEAMRMNATTTVCGPARVAVVTAAKSHVAEGGPTEHTELK